MLVHRGGVSALRSMEKKELAMHMPEVVANNSFMRYAFLRAVGMSEAQVHAAGRTPPTSAPELGAPRPHLRRD